MIEFRNSKKKKILFLILFPLLIISMIMIGIIIALEEKLIYPVIVTVLLSMALLFSMLNILLCYFKYDDEKMIFRSLLKVETVYFKDVEFFGTGKSTPIMGAGRANSVGGGNWSRLTYFLIKTKDKKYQPDIPVKYENAELIRNDLVEKIKKVNPKAVIKF